MNGFPGYRLIEAPSNGVSAASSDVVVRTLTGGGGVSGDGDEKLRSTMTEISFPFFLEKVFRLSELGPRDLHVTNRLHRFPWSGFLDRAILDGHVKGISYFTRAFCRTN